MSHHSGTNFGGLLMQLLVSILRMIGFLIGWCCKIIGFLFEKAGEVTLKLCEK